MAVTGLGAASVGLLGASDAATAGDHARSLTRTPNADIAQQFAAESPPLQLPQASAPPAPAPPTLAAGPPLQSHEIFGFAPWWNLAEEGAFDVKDLTTLAYFSVDANPDGTIDQSNSGWVGYQSQALADLVDRAHAANDRVVLTVTCFDQSALDRLTSDPNAPSTLGNSLVQLVTAKNLDGVNLDFEGNGSQDRQGLDNLVGVVAGTLRAANPHWQITMSTYASSAGDSSGFFDVPALARSVDGFFVMAYDMNDRGAPSATSPLTGSGNTDATDIAEYSQVVPRSKIILGVPYYGYDWPTAGPQAGAGATGAPAPVTYAQVAGSHLPSYWDRGSQTPWTAYQSGSQWHQIYYDDPTSMALKARLANQDGIAGLGIWALGMDGNDPAMLGALLGSAPATKYSAGPSGAAAPATTGPSASYRYAGVWNGTQEALAPVNPSTLPGGGQAHQVGTLSSFSTDDPRFTCLANGPALPVYELTASPTTYVVQTSTPSWCAAGTWDFTAPARPSGGTGGSGGSGTTTPTTAPGGTPSTTSPPFTLPLVTNPSTPASAGSSTSTTSGGILGL